MCLTIYTDKKDIPADIEYIDYNDKFFEMVPLKNDAITKKILKTIDKAEYNSENTFIGRDESLGALNKAYLSTGTKTLLNILSNPDKCFDVVECGQNALNFIPFMKEGHIFWKMPVLHYTGNETCDIMVHNKHFTNFEKFLQYVMEEESGHGN